jgi:hypothetical protein
MLKSFFSGDTEKGAKQGARMLPGGTRPASKEEDHVYGN